MIITNRIITNNSSCSKVVVIMKTSPNLHVSYTYKLS